MTDTQKIKIAVHKFSSCDGCQLAFLNMGEDLLVLADQVEIAHFAEAGIVNEEADVDVAFVEGSISTPHEEQRIKAIRDSSKYLITIGACATSGGFQALRNIYDNGSWHAELYAKPEYIKVLKNSSPIESQVKVDFQLWGCPINSRQVLAAVKSLLNGAMPQDENEKVCMECKRHQVNCVLVTKNEACMGAVTRTGCGALCPQFGRDCYGCFGPAEAANTDNLARWFQGIGLTGENVRRRFHFIYSAEKPFKDVGEKFNQ